MYKNYTHFVTGGIKNYDIKKKEKKKLTLRFSKRLYL